MHLLIPPGYRRGGGGVGSQDPVSRTDFTKIHASIMYTFNYIFIHKFMNDVCLLYISYFSFPGLLDT